MVITIIGLLVGLLLPAVQSAREAGRKSQCSNNCKQFALACLAHEEAQKYLPTGGWGSRRLGIASVAGVASGGFGPTQPGGWIYNILPNLDQDPLWNGTDATATKMLSLVQTPLPVLNCPSRRLCKVYPVAYPTSIPFGLPTSPPLPQVARSDYAMNGNYKVGGIYNDNQGPSDLNSITPPPPFISDGVTGQAWWASMASITDGPANTYLLGEKFIPSDHYTDGLDYGDNENAYIGSDRDTLRTDATDSRPAHRQQCPKPVHLRFRQRPLFRISHGVLRRARAAHPLYDQPDGPPGIVQSPRRGVAGPERTLNGGAGADSSTDSWLRRESGGKAEMAELGSQLCWAKCISAFSASWRRIDLVVRGVYAPSPRSGIRPGVYAGWQVVCQPRFGRFLQVVLTMRGDFSRYLHCSSGKQVFSSPQPVVFYAIQLSTDQCAWPLSWGRCCRAIRPKSRRLYGLQ